jgi:hypothetical protein
LEPLKTVSENARWNSEVEYNTHLRPRENYQPDKLIPKCSTHFKVSQVVQYVPRMSYQIVAWTSVLGGPHPWYPLQPLHHHPPPTTNKKRGDATTNISSTHAFLSEIKIVCSFWGIIYFYHANFHGVTTKDHEIQKHVQKLNMPFCVKIK